MAVKERTQAPAPTRVETPKSPVAITPARTNTRDNKKNAEAGAAATTIQRARASVAMQQRMGNARASQTIDVARPGTGAAPTVLSTQIVLPAPVPKPGAAKETKPSVETASKVASEKEANASPRKRATATPEKETTKTTTLPKASTTASEVKVSEAVPPEEKAFADRPEAAEASDKEGKSARESGEAETAGAAKPVGEVKEGSAAKSEDKEKKAGAEGKPEAGKKADKEGAKAQAPPSPREAIAPAISAVRNRAAGASQHSAPSAAVGSAQAAAINPATEQTRAAATQTVTNLDATEAEKVKRNEFKAKLMQAIEAATPKPKTKDEAENVMKTGAAQASGALRGEMSAQSEQAAGPLQSAAVTEVPPSSQPAPPKTTLEPEPIGEPPAEVSAAPVVPAPLPAEQLDYSSDRAPTENAMAEANVTSDQLQKGNEPEFGQALGARTEAEEHETKAEATYRQSEAKVRDDARSSAEKKLANELGGIHGARAAQIGKVVGQQTQTVDKNAQERQRITETIDGIKNKTRADVTAILDTMEKEAGDIFEAGLKRAEQAYEDTFEEAKGGIGTWLTTWGDDWEKLIENSLTKARAEYLRQVGVAIDEVSNLVDGKLQAAKQRVANGRMEVENFVKTVDDSVTKFGEEALQSVSADFDAMGTEIDERRDGLINKLAEQYKASYERMSAKETELREANKSLWQRVYDATVGLIKKIIEFKNMLMSVLAKAADVIGLIIGDPIGFLGNLIDGVQKGIQNFSDRIGEHLKKGLIEWLFGELAAGGIQIPETFDLKGILSLVMQVLGLTYENIRGRAVTIVGEPIVKAIEQAAEIFKILVTEGPAGLWKYIKEQIGDFKEMILEQIKSFIIEKVIKAGIMWLVGLLNPASGFFKACKAIYDIVMFFVERATQIMAFVNAVIDSMASIARGAIDVAAKAVENALAKAIPVVIGFLAALLGLSGISEKIKEIIAAIRGPINKAIDWVINLAVKAVKAAGKLVGGLFGKKEEKKEGKHDDDPQRAAKITAGLADIDKAERAYLKDGRITRKDAEHVAATVKKDHNVFTSITVVDGGEVWSYDYTASPGETHTGEKKAEKAGDKPENYELIISLNLVGKPISEFNPPPPPGYSKYQREEKFFIRRVDADDTKYQQLGVDAEQKIILGKGVSEAAALRSEAEVRKEIGPAQAGKERHHLIPLEVCASHALVREAIQTGEPPFGANTGVVFLPQDAEAAKTMPGLPIHRGSHPKWTKHVEALLNAELRPLLTRYATLSDIPKKELTAACKRVQNDLRGELSSWSIME
jgi:hypothetical protein